MAVERGGRFQWDEDQIFGGIRQDITDSPRHYRYLVNCSVIDSGSLIKDKGFIIQSGYCDFEYWAAHYNYEKIEHRMHCAPCWKRRDCGEDHKCMREISPQRVFEVVRARLKRD